MGTYYFLGAALLSGSAISSGLFVPMMMIGAIIGRLVRGWACGVIKARPGLQGKSKP
jgi:H+/Cl- antiporter ClcA